MRCVAPMELNCTMQLHCYKGLAPPELQSNQKSIFAYYCHLQCFTYPELQASLNGALPMCLTKAQSLRDEIFVA